ncbi:EamA family transporter [Gordonibacter sp. An230]|uniref:DMT family transporter n=1 Tax=Gordonibacter sp. An230 TaxID=1965592 RepID=UPI000B3874B5|nr:DMT family transporter [Gordonibacter sp. An230]OUO88019.1 EamA family transporter [Gordonibacter sp. An230]
MNEQAKYKLKGFIFMFLSSSAMGGIGAFGRYINAPGDFISFGRNFIGFIALTVIFAVAARGNFKKLRATKLSPAMVFSGIFLGLLSGLYVISTQYTTLANASFLIYTGPIYSTVLAAIFLKEKLNGKGIACIAAVVLGMLFIVGIITPQGLTLDLDPKWMFGNMIGLLSGVAYGLYLFIGRYRQDCDSNVRSWWNFLFASVTILGLMAVDSLLSGGLKYTVKVDGVQQVDAAGQIMTAPWDILTMDATSWLVWIAAALITGFVAFHLLAYATKMLKAGELAAISYQETIMASLLGFVMFNEVLTPLQLVGGALIIAGGVSQIVFSTKAAGKAGEKIEKEEEIRESLQARLEREEEKEALR